MTVIRGLVAADRSWRAWYAWWDPDESSGVRVEKHTVIGWAAVGDQIWPVRVEAQTARGVLAGSSGDSWRDALLGVLVPGDDWADIADVDSRIRGIIRAGVETQERATLDVGD